MARCCREAMISLCMASIVPLRCCRSAICSLCAAFLVWERRNSVWVRSNSALSSSSDNPSSEPSCGGGAPVCSSRSYSSSSDDVSVLLIRLMVACCYCRCRKIYNLKVRRSWLCVVLQAENRRRWLLLSVFTRLKFRPGSRSLAPRPSRQRFCRSTFSNHRYSRNQ